MAENKEQAAVIHTPDHELITSPNPLSSLISKFTQIINFHFPPPPPKKVETESKAAGNTVVRSGDAAEESKPVTVKFSDARPNTVAPLKVEAEEKDTNPVFIWQVYAIGGFFILRWVLTRWNERKANKKSSKEDSPPQPPPAAAAGDE
ncbi:hypothetical protein M8C21_020000 [Ambrosia artemisiifolia]|uniref:Uncharacterized protein n=1 Tax=Ambrosia artemisiifolia TaxID=4212 RepID=A0AAD5BVJ8_AMBAR|nr:hypothetical protein M8C21_020000 [Ambrosia artemisiifolia]